MTKTSKAIIERIGGVRLLHSGLLDIHDSKNVAVQWATFTPRDGFQVAQRVRELANPCKINLDSFVK